MVKGLLIALSFFLFACQEESSDKSASIGQRNFLDARDNQSYRIVEFDSLQWFVDKLALKFHNHFCSQQGCYYSRLEAINACPDGWHLPDIFEWKKFKNYLDQEKNVHDSLANLTYWTSSMGEDHHEIGRPMKPVALSLRYNWSEGNVDFSIDFADSAFVLCTKKINDQFGESASIGTWFNGIIDFGRRSFGCEHRKIYLDIGNDSLYRCEKGGLMSAGFALNRPQDTVNVPIKDSVIKSIAFLPDCSGPLKGRTFRTGEDSYFYYCEKLRWKPIGYFVPTVKREKFIDSRDNQKYDVIVVDSIRWLGENLNYKMNGSVCYENQENNCRKFGRMYPGQIAERACPMGWRIPEEDDWDKLNEFVGFDGSFLRAKKGWFLNFKEKNYDIGFNALPAGEYCRPRLSRDSMNFFLGLGTETAWFRSLFDGLGVKTFDGNELGRQPVKKNSDSKFYIRCIQRVE